MSTMALKFDFHLNQKQLKNYEPKPITVVFENPLMQSLGFIYCAPQVFKEK